MKRASPKLGRLLRHPFAATVAARTQDSSRIALTFARAPFGSGRCAAIYRPCCWYNFRVAAEIFGFLLAILRFAILALRAIGNDPFSRFPTLTAPLSRAARLASNARTRRSRRWSAPLRCRV